MKTCPRCTRDQPRDAFGRNKTRKDGLQVHCKECTKATGRAYYLRTPEKNDARRATTERRRFEIRTWVAAYLTSHPCVDCDLDDIRVLEFDHVRGVKKFNVADAARLAVSQARLEEEVAKCEVRCANCHRIATGHRDGRWHKHRTTATS